MARQQAVSVSGKPLSKTTSTLTKLPRGCLVVFFGLFFLIGTILFFTLFVTPLAEYLAAGQWIETPCAIISSKVVSDQSSDGTTYKPEIKFRYRFEEQEYESDRCQFLTVSTSSRGRAERIVAEHPAGQRSTCFVNPRNPGAAVLNRQLTWDFLIGLLPLTFVAIGLGGILFAWRAGKKSSGRTDFPNISRQHADFDGDHTAQRTLPSYASGGAMLHESDADVDDGDSSLPSRQPEGPLVLSPESTPVGRFLGLLAVSIFWNGIVSIFLGFAISSFVRGKPEWLLTLFMIPFVLVGIGLVLGALHALLGIFNPRPTLTLLRSNLCLGDRTQVRWQFQGSTRRIRKLVIFLRGSETAKYRRGTKTHTDISEFYNVNLVETESPLDMAEGTTEVEIPAASMHTFLGTNNQITWHLVVHGDIPLWPDVSVAFPLTVYPIPLDDDEIVL